jgi:hypothetical protein
MNKTNKMIINGLAGLALTALPFQSNVNAQSENSWNAHFLNISSNYSEQEYQSLIDLVKEHGRSTRFGNGEVMYDFIAILDKPPLDELIDLGIRNYGSEHARTIVLRYDDSPNNLLEPQVLSCTIITPTGDYLGYVFKDLVGGPEEVVLGMRNPLSSLGDMYYLNTNDTAAHSEDARLCLDVAKKKLEEYVESKR